MKLHRFIIDQSIEDEFLNIEDENIAQQLREVLRYKPGYQLIISDGKKTEALCKILNLTKNGVELKVLNKTVKKQSRNRIVTLYCSILKRTNFELVVQKATEIGVYKIVPIITKRTVKLNVREDRLKRIIKEAAEQSGRIDLPELLPTNDFENALKDSLQHDTQVLFDLNGEPFIIIRDEISKSKSVGGFVGPEGGWEKSEIKLANEHDVVSVKISNYVLRAETAAIIGSYLVTK